MTEQEIPVQEEEIKSYEELPQPLVKPESVEGFKSKADYFPLDEDVKSNLYD